MSQIVLGYMMPEKEGPIGTYCTRVDDGCGAANRAQFVLGHQIVLLVAVLSALGCTLPQPDGADFRKGEEAYNRYRYPEALEQFKPLAEAGDSEAQFFLGKIYSNGYLELIPQDHLEALKWFTLSAEQGNANAQYELFDLYDEGKGVSRDDPEALRWLKQAADQGHAEALFVLGSKHFEDRKAWEAAKSWIPAAEAGHLVSKGNLEALYDGDELPAPEDPKEAVEWYTLGAEHGVGTAQLMLGAAYYDGSYDLEVNAAEA